MIQLIHLDKPYAYMRHCVGDAPERLKRALAAGRASARVARTWLDKGPDFVERLRAQHGLSRYCPVCSGSAAYGRDIPVGRSPEDPGRFRVRASEQAALCLQCPLRDCVGTESSRCPINIAQRRRWREYAKERRAARRLAKAAALLETAGGLR
jgi:hypothetical protein